MALATEINSGRENIDNTDRLALRTILSLRWPRLDEYLEEHPSMIDYIGNTKDGKKGMITKRCGLGWETNLSVGFNLEQQQDLQNRQNTEAKRIHSHNKAERLIDYTYIQDLEGLIKKHWNQVFCNIFPWSLHNVEYMFDILLNYRDVLMHGRDENIPSYKKYLCLGVCGEILIAISYWCLGFRRRGDISSCKCNMFFGLSKDDPDCESKARELTEQWIDTIMNLVPNLRKKWMMTVDIKNG